jgi:hypothetical protein
MANPPKGDFCIVIDFDKESSNPERIFMAMSNIITSFKKLDDSLIKSIDKNITPVLILEDIEAGSIKTWLKQLIEQINDDALKNIDWKPLVGQYLVKAKYIVLNFLEGKTRITDSKEIKKLQNDLYELAEKTDVNKFPSYTPVSVPKLIDNIDRINTTLQPLNHKDKVSFLSQQGDATFNLDFNFVPNEIEDLLTKETLSNTSLMILKVKKPDYLGNSQWEFKYDKRTIFVKISDADWLTSFQQRKQDVRPGDSIKGTVKIDVKYGYDMNVINTHYEIIKVDSIVRDETFNPQIFDEDEDAE